ncbi:MAG: uncharacterized protein PWP15_775 [Methanothermococcus sp.]|jgi:hypothetical protein|uniref:UPF0179 family protein n=1 Tax=Methanothermococcus TaxID=155862 RepID=UPI000371D791|nr:MULTISPECIES: UPF0179 family protein [Methanothermococcus]MDK2790268.1 uncharacterized protein [Methanothermococcus sp.]MDK2987728.1 uncharacterized protein [Methanothermococcus sp.]
MKKITLIGSELAKTGNEFIYVGLLEECESCRFKRICHNNLEEGKRYKIVSVRSANHPCDIHENGVKVVEVVPAEFVIIIESKKALEGVTLSHSDIQCDNVLCENYLLCHPEGICEKYKVVSVLNEKIKCPKGISVKKVVISPL